ncbi:MAG: type IV toxin-antitoxin system AbiEi family antitoxin domain-containing protein [bacterium]
MKFDKLVEKFGTRPYFELKEVLALDDNQPKTTKNQLSKWSGDDKIIRIGRGKYLLNKTFRKQSPSVYYIANQLLRPSYVSLHTALQFHGLIPEAVFLIQSITPKHGRTRESDLGTFKYYSIKQERFWGYKKYSSTDKNIPQNSFLMARPEKSLLDLFYSQAGEWPEERISEMRFQNIDKIDFERLKNFTERFNSPRINRAVDNLILLYGSEKNERSSD